MDDKVMERRQSCIFCPIWGLLQYQWEDGGERHRSRYQAFVLHVSLSGRKKQGQWCTEQIWVLSLSHFWTQFLRLLVIFEKGGRSWRSDHHLFTLLVREGSQSLKAQDGWTRNTWDWTAWIHSSLLVTRTLSPGEDTAPHTEPLRDCSQDQSEQAAAVRGRFYNNSRMRCLSLPAGGCNFLFE